MSTKAMIFLVLLGGTPAEHVIALPSYDACYRAAEAVTDSQCLNTEEYVAYLLSRKSVDMNYAPASGAIEPPGAADADDSSFSRFPSATQRRLRDVLLPGREEPIKRVVPEN